MSSRQMGQHRQMTVFHKWHVWHEESQDGRNQQNADDVVLEVQKLVGTALTDNQVSFRVHTCRQWDTDGILSDHWRPTMNDVASPRIIAVNRLRCGNGWDVISRDLASVSRPIYSDLGLGLGLGLACLVSVSSWQRPRPEAWPPAEAKNVIVWT